VQRLRAFQGICAHLQRYEVDLFDFAGNDTEAATLLRSRRGFSRPERDRAEELRRREGMTEPSLVLQAQRVGLALPKYDP
jgi:hypothetical protein